MAEDVGTVRNNGVGVEPKNKGGFLFVVLLILLALGGGGGCYYVRYALPFVTTDDAFIEAGVVRVSPQVNGQLLKVNVDDNQVVKAGEVLVEIDPQPFAVRVEADQAALKLAEARLTSAKATVDLTKATTDATLDQAEAEVQAAKAMVEQARAEVGAAETDAKRTASDSGRYDRLDNSAISIQRRELADSMARVASAHVTEARKAVAAAEAKVEAAEGKRTAARTGPQQVAVAVAQAEQAAAAVEQAKAALDGSNLQLSYTKVTAPVAGSIARKSVHVGETVQAGQALMALVPDTPHVIANFKETQLTRMRVGQLVDVYMDAHPGIVLKGHVDSFQSGTGARFSLLPPENATGNYVKVIQRVPVKIVFDEPLDPHMLIAPGMSVVPKVRVQ
ncbi:MAG: HlyD family secretion protein [Candidatus Hydrogenedentes bacterium]|nr:HlyD family secretion protein [Candidatus Hydrogenedentota bacterium]